MNKISPKTNPGQYDPAFLKENMDRLRKDLNKCLIKHGVDPVVPHDKYRISDRNNHENTCFTFACKNCKWASRCPYNNDKDIEKKCTALVKELKTILDTINL